MMRHKLLVLVSTALFIVMAHTCPDKCSCRPRRIDCTNSLRTSISLEKGTEYLSLTFNEIINLKNDFFRHPENLTTLYLNNNKMEGIEPEVFSKMFELQHLYIHNNQLESIHPSVFQYNQKLKSIDLSHNRIEKISPKLFELNKDLLWVNVTGNKLNLSSIGTLNTVRVEFCATPSPYVSYLLNFPILNTLRPNRSYMSTSTSNVHVQNNETYLHNTVNIPDFNKSGIKFDSSVVCFCDRISTWFWCSDKEFACLKLSDMYSYLTCNSVDLVVNKSTKKIVRVTSTASIKDSVASTASSRHVMRLIPTSPHYKISTTISHSSVPPKDQQSPPMSEIYKFALIGIGIFVVVILTVIISIIVCRRKMTRALNGEGSPTVSVGSVVYNPVPTTEDVNNAMRQHFNAETANAMVSERNDRTISQVSPYQVTNLLLDNQR